MEKITGDAEVPARKARAERRALDFYETPRKATQALLARLPELIRDYDDAIFEPCTGEGAIAKVLWEAGKQVWQNDYDRARSADWHLDARRPEVWTCARSVGCQWAITNPPFSDAAEIIQAGIGAGLYIAALLRLSFLEPTRHPTNGRMRWLSQQPPARLVVLPRISFTQDRKTDSVTSAWMIWAPVTPGVQVVGIEWLERT